MEETSITLGGMDKISTVRDLVALWPSRQDLAEDLGFDGKSRIDKWVQANSIPAPHLSGVFDAACKRAFNVTAEQLLRIAGGGKAASDRSAA